MGRDIEYLNRVLKLKEKDTYQSYFNWFNWIYPFTNENISGYYNSIDFFSKSVLTVTSSGDHALNAYVKGAKSIDTFDINPLAKYYSELKIAAIKTLTYEEFILFLYNKNNFLIPEHYLSKPLYNKVRVVLDDNNKYFWDYLFNTYSIKQINKSLLFTSDYLDLKNLSIANIYFNKENYYKLRDILNKKSITYYDLDINNISNISNQYDIISLSNIPSYLSLSNIDFKQSLIKLKIMLNKLKKEDSTIVFSYLYGKITDDYPIDSLHNPDILNKYFSDYDRIYFDKASMLSKPKYLRKILNNKDSVLIKK